MGAEQSRTSSNSPGVHETDFVVIGSGIGGMLQAKQLNGGQFDQSCRQLIHR